MLHYTFSIILFAKLFPKHSIIETLNIEIYRCNSEKGALKMKKTGKRERPVSLGRGNVIAEFGLQSKS